MANHPLFPRPLLFGHRGDPSVATENTLEAFTACIEGGIDGVELDVQLCKSGELVIFHDATLKRMADLPTAVADMTLDELQEIELIGGGRIPTLDSLFRLAKTELLYDLEIKVSTTKETGTSAALLALIKEHHLESSVCVSSFNPIEVRRFRRLAKNAIPTALIYSETPDLPKIFHHGWGRHIARPTFLKPERSQALKAQERGFTVLTWTVDGYQEAEALLKAGVSGIISNRPVDLLPLFTG